MFSELLNYCREWQKDRKIYIQTHNFPDPDALATAFGLQKLLLANEIDSIICYEGRIDKISTSKMLNTFGIEIFEYDELRSGMKEEDCIICVDSQKMGGNITDFVGDEVACIDHHPTYVQIDYQYSDIRKTGACATLIAEYFKESGIVPDTNVATALVYGIKMDTAQFSRGVTPLDIEMYGYLFPMIDKEKLSELEHCNLEIKDLQAYGAAIKNIELYEYVGFSFIPFACPDALIGILSDFILSLVEVDVSIICSERPDGYKFSVRSSLQEINAGDLVRSALDGIGNGGGHAAMAGGLIKAENAGSLGSYPYDAIRERFIDAWEKIIPQK